MKILKFGGSSLADSKCMQNVLEILKNRQEEKIVLVLSACQNITNKLAKAAELSKNKNINLALSIAQEIKQLHLELIANINNKSILEEAKTSIFNLCSELESLLEGIYLLNELTPLVIDRVYSFGEILSSKTFYYISLDAKLKSNWLDIRNIIITDSNFGEANPLPDKIAQSINLINSELEVYNILVTQGFIGFDLLKRTTTLGRGGSDFSASIIGAALLAESIEIWTDVDGILSADPRIVTKNIFSIPLMSYSEVKDLSFCGAKILHPKSILPAMKQKVPVKVLNSFNSTSIGTTIIPELENKITTTTTNNNNNIQNYFSQSDKLVLHSIVAKHNCLLIETEVIENIDSVASFINSLKILIQETNSQLIYHSYSNQKLISLISAGPTLKDSRINLLLENISISNITRVINNMSVICITGENLASNPFEFGKILNSIVENMSILNSNIAQFIYIFSKTSLMFLTEATNTDEIIKLLHEEIIVKYSTIT